MTNVCVTAWIPAFQITKIFIMSFLCFVEAGARIERAPIFFSTALRRPTRAHIHTFTIPRRRHAKCRQCDARLDRLQLEHTSRERERRDVWVFCH